MARYHITAKGNPALCRAYARPCPLGGEHYSSKAEATAAYESTMNSTPPTFTAERLTVADEESIVSFGERAYRLNHQAPVKDADDFNKPLHSLADIFPADVYDHPDWYGQQHPETLEQLKAARNNPEAMVTIYRAVPEGVVDIHPGDWVALSYEYARGEAYHTGYQGGEGQVVSHQVPAKLLYTDANSLEEWGFSGNISLKGVVTT